MAGGGAGGAEHGCKEQVHPLATVHAEAPSNSSSPPPPPPAAAVLSVHDVVASASEEKQDQEKQKEKQEQEQEEDEEQEQELSASLPTDVVIDILSRTPYKSLCRFKCVSKPWFAICSHPQIVRKVPQTLTGFFYHDNWEYLRFINMNGRGRPMVDPSLSFLRRWYREITVDQCSVSLLLCICWPSARANKCDYVVCNPATQQWAVLPPLQVPGSHRFDLLGFHSIRLYLGFDRSAPSRFAVYAVPSGTSDDQSTRVMVFSSETGIWTCMQSRWNRRAVLVNNTESVFLNGALHLPICYPSLLTVGRQGKPWKLIKLPVNSPQDYYEPCIGHSQGRLCTWYIDYEFEYLLFIWVLEDYDTGRWILKHTVDVLQLFESHVNKSDIFYRMMAIHPDRNMIFLTNQEEVVSFDIDNKELCHICAYGQMHNWLPYTPCFEEWSSQGH